MTLPTAAVLDHLDRLYLSKTSDHGSAFAAAEYATTLEVAGPWLIAAARELLEIRTMCFDFEICGDFEGCEGLNTEPTPQLVRLGFEMWKDARKQCSKVVQADDAVRKELATVIEERDRMRAALLLLVDATDWSTIESLHDDAASHLLERIAGARGKVDSINEFIIDRLEGIVDELTASLAAAEAERDGLLAALIGAQEWVDLFADRSDSTTGRDLVDRINDVLGTDWAALVRKAGT